MITLRREYLRMLARIESIFSIDNVHRSGKRVLIPAGHGRPIITPGVFRGWLGNVRKRISRGEPDPEVPIFMHEQAFVESTNLVQARTTMHETENWDVILNQQPRRIEVRGMGLVAPRFGPYSIDVSFRDSPGIGIGYLMSPTLKKVNEGSKMLRQEAIVVIEIGNVSPFGHPQAGIA